VKFIKVLKSSSVFVWIETQASTYCFLLDNAILTISMTLLPKNMAEQNKESTLRMLL